MFEQGKEKTCPTALMLARVYFFFFFSLGVGLDDAYWLTLSQWVQQQPDLMKFFIQWLPLFPITGEKRKSNFFRWS